MNKYVIKLMKGKQSPYGSINTFNLVELETIKVYIITNLKTGFIYPFKSLVYAYIFFDKKFDSSFYLHINYQGLNILIIKN